MLFDLIMDYDTAVQIVKDVGFDGWVKFVAEKLPGRDFYSASTDWFEHGPRYIAKLRGGFGDALIGWSKK